MHGFTQSELARRLDVTRSSVNAWEMGTSLPGITKLMELAQFFGVSTDYLLGLEQEPSLSLAPFNWRQKELLCSLAEYFMLEEE